MLATRVVACGEKIRQSVPWLHAGVVDVRCSLNAGVAHVAAQ